MNRFWTFAMGLTLTMMAVRSRRGLLRLPLGLLGARFLSRSLARDQQVPRGLGRLGWRRSRDHDISAAPGSELPAWW
jgi:hypothetical protein